jgi:hypothetical protein
MRPSVQQPISKCYGPDKKILFKKPLFDLEGKSQGHRKVIMVRDTPPYGHAPTYQISLTYLERNNYLTLRSKVKVQQRSLWYATHCPMVMHIHTKYHWPILKDKNVMARTTKYYSKKHYLTLRSRSHKGHYVTRQTVLRSCPHIPNIIDLSRKKQLFDLEVKGQGPMKVIAVCETPPYGHTPTYQISLTYLKTKMLWSRQENTI